MQQQQQIMRQISDLTIARESENRRSHREGESSTSFSTEPVLRNQIPRNQSSPAIHTAALLNTVPLANAVSLLSRQIPDFGGQNQKNVTLLGFNVSRKWLKFTVLQMTSYYLQHRVN